MSRYMLNYIIKYPEFELQDIFKFIYQDIFGPGHLIPSYDIAYKYLKEECQTLSCIDIKEELYDEISEKVIRVNLRPYIQKGYRLETLVEMMIESQTYYQNVGDIRNKFEQYKETVKRIIDINDDVFEMEIDKCFENNFKPFSHSKKFHNNYDPHYRIVIKEIFLKHIKLS